MHNWKKLADNFFGGKRLCHRILIARKRYYSARPRKILQGKTGLLKRLSNFKYYRQSLPGGKGLVLRTLDSFYPVVFLDAVHFKVREEGRVVTKAAYVALGINGEGYKDILGIWIVENEGAKFWLKVCNELKNRGVQDIACQSIRILFILPAALLHCSMRNKYLCFYRLFLLSCKCGYAHNIFCRPTVFSQSLLLSKPFSQMRCGYCFP